MKGGLFYYLLKTEKGMVFPYVYFLSILMITIIITSLSSLKIHSELLFLEEEQLRMETLLLSSYHDLLQNIDLDQLQNITYTAIFTYEDGTVHITYSKLNEASLQANFSVQTKRQTKKAYKLMVAIGDEGLNTG